MCISISQKEILPCNKKCVIQYGNQREERSCVIHHYLGHLSTASTATKQAASPKQHLVPDGKLL